MSGWIGVDFDGTLATDGDSSPIKPMVDRVKNWLAVGIEVRILTARVNPHVSGGYDVAEQIAIVQAWCERHIGQRLAVTCYKDYDMYQLWDDRAVQVIRDTGERVGSVNRPSAKQLQGTIIDKETGYIR